MLQKTRLKLTGWYLLIIMLVSFLFSMAIYGNITRQIEGLIRMQNDRIRNFQNNPLQGIPPRLGTPPVISTEELVNQKKQLFYTLTLINFGVLIIAGGAGYFLAGKTLHPIQLMVDEQNQFISDASHELRTPIATLQAEMEAGLLEKRISDRKARVLIKSNLEELKNLKDIINGLLKLTRIHYSDNNQKMENISLLSVIEQAKKRVLPLANKKELAINLEIPEVIVQGNKDMLTEVFMILFDNAIKFSPNKSSVTVTVVKNQHRVKINVADKGVGIPKKDLPYIYERFYRGDKSRSSIEGFGLGLSIAKKVIESHKGTIKAKSIVNKGSIFTVDLPLSAS